MAKKWIIKDGVLRMGFVSYHRDLLRQGEDSKGISGGGLWEENRYRNALCFFHTSFDFGFATEEQFNSCDKSCLMDFRCGEYENYSIESFSNDLFPPKDFIRKY